MAFLSGHRIEGSILDVWWIIVLGGGHVLSAKAPAADLNK